MICRNWTFLKSLSWAVPMRENRRPSILSAIRKAWLSLPKHLAGPSTSIFFPSVAHMSASTGTILSGKAKSTCFWSICPGYGFAQVSGSAKEHWQKLLSDYLIHRQQLTGLVLVMDARHPFQPLDVQLLEWFAVTGKPVHCLLTKADKLNRSESTNALKQVDTILKSYVDEEGNPFPFTAQLFSSTKRIGIKEATDTILQLAGGNEPPDTPDLPEQ